MRRTWTVFSLSALLLLISSAGVSLATEDSGMTRPLNVIANDNRAAAGLLKDGTLELKLEILSGYWHPEHENGTRLLVQAFAEEGKAPVDPGPLIRVPQGTDIHVSIHNSLDKAAVVHGLHARPGYDRTPLEIPAGETRSIGFRAGDSGTYYYWVTTTGAKDYKSRDSAAAGGIDSQLVGALVADPAGGAPPDRIFVLNIIDIPEDPFHVVYPLPFPSEVLYETTGTCAVRNSAIVFACGDFRS